MLVTTSTRPPRPHQFEPHPSFHLQSCEKMALLNLAILCVLLAAASEAQVCPRITGSDLGNTATQSTVGLIAERLGLGSQPPAVQLHRFNIVCEATSGARDGFRHVSLVAEYTSNDVVTLSQFEFSCVGATSPEWSIFASSSTDSTITTSPSADFSTPLRRDCFLCLSPARLGTADPVNHCATCHDSCMGLRQCTTQSSFSCCNYYNLDGNCVNACPGQTVPQPDNNCGCRAGTTGPNCENMIDFCIDTPCMNSGTCMSVGGSFQCTCSEDYTGDMCETFIDPCEADPCLNGGTCTRESATRFTCVCPVGYGDDTCVDINECDVSPNLCRNGGTCMNSVGNYSCACQENWEGPNCETCGIRNCVQCSGNGASCMLCELGYFRNNQGTCTLSTERNLCEQDCINGFCVQGTCVCNPEFENPPNCTALCTLGNCQRCTPDGVACEVCTRGFVVEANGGLCVRGISREINLTDIQIIGIVVGCSLTAIILVILVLCCCAFICKHTCRGRSSDYTESKPVIKQKPKRHVKKVAKKISIQESSIMNHEAMEEGLDEEGLEKDVDLDITHF